MGQLAGAMNIHHQAWGVETTASPPRPTELSPTAFTLSPTQMQALQDRDAVITYPFDLVPHFLSFLSSFSLVQRPLQHLLNFMG